MPNYKKHTYKNNNRSDFGMKGVNMQDYTIKGVLGVSGSVLATLPGALTPDGIVQLVSIICSVAIALTTVGLQIYTAIKKRNDGGAEYLKGLDVKTLDQLLKELKEREQTQAEEKAKLKEEADANEYAPVTLPDEVE